MSKQASKSPLGMSKMKLLNNREPWTTWTDQVREDFQKTIANIGHKYKQSIYGREGQEKRNTLL
jgi:hypothetical protein